MGHFNQSSPLLSPISESKANRDTITSLYGQPSHLDYIAQCLRARYPPSKLHIHSVRRNKGYLTYDGIELGGERVAHEIEELIYTLSEEQGCRIKKLSIVGYSLGGLVSRYAIGLLYARGYFDDGENKITPMNFTTFASPHVGVRNPARRNHLWNVIGARTISTSGRQLFMIDDFRGTGKPLLNLMATRGSVFMLGLEKFKYRSLYANVVNDAAATFYTTCISKTNPFAQVTKRKESVNYVKGYEPVVIDHERYYIEDEDNENGGYPAFSKARKSPLEFAFASIINFIRQIPFYLFLMVCLPVGSIAYLVNAFFQTILSKKRIKLHQESKLSTIFSSYDVPLIVDSIRNATNEMMNEVYESIDASRPAEYLSDGSTEACREEEEADEEDQVLNESTPLLNSRSNGPHTRQAGTKTATPTTTTTSTTTSPTVVTNGIGGRETPRTLALTPAQFEIIDNLNALGFKKYPVYIHKHRHSHAAMIVRVPKPGFEEGKTVIRHWLDREFVVD